MPFTVVSLLIGGLAWWLSGDPVRFAEQRETKRKELEGQAFEALVDSLIAQRKLDLKVTYDRALLEELGLAGDAARGS